MGCFIDVPTPPCIEELPLSARTDPSACVSPFDTWRTIPPEDWYTQSLPIIKDATIEGRTSFEKVDNGVHMLQRGISIAQGAYQIGRLAAPYVDAML